MHTMRLLASYRQHAYLSNLVSQLTQSCLRDSRPHTGLLTRLNHLKYLSTAPNDVKKEEKSPQTYEVTFVKRNGDRIKASGKEGDSLLDVVVNNNLDFDGFGACEGTLTCSTCHVILKKQDYDKLPEKPSEEELDMLDLAFELTDTSRLGCQIMLSKDLDGLEVQLPSTINDARG
ncbi:adrenodoxin-like protein 2, mitochondrial [Planococcus citri]|uniref:adrenodoxin-like protein 2, mitochondrial n=1 Tax=Planococcus citri TaxID=170843 RepID=UPI0031F85720